VVRAKRGRPRRQPLPAQLAAELTSWLAIRQPALEAPVFCGLAGGPLQPAALAQIISRAALRGGLQKHVTAHTLRHTSATWLRQAGADARLVAEYLGHADLTTVTRYAHVASEEIHDAAQTLADSSYATLAHPAHTACERSE
jgi:integrase/recombinase XerC